MDYNKIYYQIIKRGNNRKLEGYIEKHHIIPKCIGGSDDEDNIVELTAREHFLCHMLLCEIYPKEYKLKHALFLMAIGKNKVIENHYVISSRVYERLRTEYSVMLTGKEQTQETKNKKSKSMIKVWKSKSKEQRSQIGKKRWETRYKNETHTPSDSQKKNISKALKGRKITWDRGVNKSILQYDKNNNFIKEWDSIAEAKRKVGGDISAALAGNQKTAGGFVWKYKD